MDMVGGGPETKAVFHVTRGPMSLPSFVHDGAWAFAEWVNEESYKFAATGKTDYPLVAPEGGKEPLRAEYSSFTMGSDHDVYQDSSFGIPAIYLNDWPDRYIHTNFDTAANIDPTKLKRAAFIGAASGYYLAQLSGSGRDALSEQAAANRLELTSVAMGKMRQVSEQEGGNILRQGIEYTRRSGLSFDRFTEHLAYHIETPGATSPMDQLLNTIPPQAPAQGEGVLKFKRRPEPKGPLAVFGYDHFAEHAKAAGVATPKLLSYEGLWGSGEEYAYEVLNFADGKRNAQGIRDAVSVVSGPVPLEVVAEYLKALEKTGVVEQVK